MVAYSNHPESQERTVGRADAMLEAGVKGMLQATESTPLTKKSITQDGFPGREISYHHEGGPAPTTKANGRRAKFVLVNGRMYQVVIVGSETMAKSSHGRRGLCLLQASSPVGSRPQRLASMKAAGRGSAKSTAEFATFSSPPPDDFRGSLCRASPRGKPRTRSSTLAAGNIQVVTYEVNHVDGQYIIGTSDYPEKLMRAPPMSTRAWRGARTALLRAPKGKLLGSKKIQARRLPGARVLTYSLNSAEIGGKASRQGARVSGEQPPLPGLRHRRGDQGPLGGKRRIL